jgi:uncharacterized iron-regulated membrane protein
MRAWFVRLHRWFGLGAAAFLFVAGATGAVISWDHELDEWLNPQLFQARTAGPALSTIELAARVEAAEPRARVTFLPLAIEPGHAVTMSVQPRIDPATGRPFALGYNQVAVDPATGAVQGRRQWGDVSLSRENLLPFLYKLHYSLHLPAAGGIELGIWFMGLIAIAWVLDTLIALAVSFPSRATWRRSLAFRWRAGGHRLTFDLHRSGGVWLFLLVLMLAVTSVGMNLNREVMRPLVSTFSTLTPSPFASRAPAPPERPIEPAIDLASAVALATQEARRRGIVAPAGGVFLSTEFGVWGVGFFEPGRAHGDGGLGNPWLYLDSRSGRPAGADVPGTGSAGDLFMQSMFPLHSGRILGLAGRVLMSLMGVAIATLSMTGVLIWARKRRARVQRQLAAAPATTRWSAPVQPRTANPGSGTGRA